MGSVKVEAEFDAPAEEVWSLLRDFGDLGWMPGPPQLTTEGEGEGMLRRIAMGPKQIVERLDARDDEARTLSYAILENNPLPVDDYRATMKVSESGDGCALEWSCSYRPLGLSEGDAEKAVEGFYGTMIGWIRDAVAK